MDKNLNKEQLEAVNTTEGTVKVIAGAGSGKTKALTERYLHLVTDYGISPDKILCVTFTNKAANEMKKRVRVRGEFDLSFICTLHGFCLQLLRKESNYLYTAPNFGIIDEEDQKSIMREIYHQFGLTSKDCTFKSLQKFIHKQKKDDDPYYYEIMSSGNLDTLNEQRKNASFLKQKLYYEYLYWQKKNESFDFDDLILLAAYLLETEKDVYERWQFEYVMVDEYQDISKPQDYVINLVSGKYGNLFVVGDEDQTIYSWRGADVDTILNFPASTKIVMDQNYRSVDKILNASNALINKNTIRDGKELHSNNPHKGRVIYFHAKTSEEQASWIARQIKGIHNTGPHLKYETMAIIYRSHYSEADIEKVLIREQIPYIIYGGTAFYKRAIIKDVFAYLKLIEGNNNAAFYRIVNRPARGLGKKSIDKVKAYAEEHSCSGFEALKALELSKNSKAFVELVEQFRMIKDTRRLSDFVQDVMDAFGYEEKTKVEGDITNAQMYTKLKQTVINFEEVYEDKVLLADYLDAMSLYTDADETKNGDAVKLMTIHAAKGLEFPAVFVCDMSEGIIPSKKTHTKEQMEEERRLAYVAFTRAEQLLCITDAEGKLPDGKGFKSPSRFIFDCEKVNVEYLVELPDELVPSPTVKYTNNVSVKYDYYKRGDRVNHDKFGEGTIYDVDFHNRSIFVKFDAIENPRTISWSAEAIKKI